jgi:HK97 gp10 family phage protein
MRLDADAEAKLAALGDKFVAEKVLPQVADAAKRIVPVDSGDLQRSIHTEVSAEGMFVVADEEYAAFVENGTSKQAAQPFLRPALNTKIKG